MKPTVLVVDDEPDITTLIRTSLEEDGYEVLVAGSEAQFREVVAAENVDLFIFDINLPDGSGLSLVRDVRRTSDVGIIILTGRMEETDRVVGLEIGADDYIVKPFRIRELRARVNSVFRRSRGIQYGAEAETSPAAETAPVQAHTHSGHVLKFEGYRVVISARQVFLPDDSEIELTTSEFDLLVALVQRRGQVMNREQLMNAVKGRDWESYDRAIDGLVSRLRRKLPAPPGASHYIRTVHGVGYVFRT